MTTPQLADALASYATGWLIVALAQHVELDVELAFRPEGHEHPHRFAFSLKGVPDFAFVATVEAMPLP